MEDVNRMKSGEQAWQLLLEGNKRFVTSGALHPQHSVQRRQELAPAKAPLAVVLGCSDSRVPPEILFDRGLGDLFTVRVAGNVLSDAVIGSIEFAAGYLNCPLIVVLAHARCGAVSAAVKGGKLVGRLPRLVELLEGALRKARDDVGDPVDNVVRAHGRFVAAQLRTLQPILAPLVADGKLKIVAAYYDLDTGGVETLA
jgi:carbonic anhydrase